MALATTAFWASAFDAFLQDFKDAAIGNDKVRLLVASARVAQLGSVCAQFFAEGTKAQCEDQVDARIVNATCNTVAEMCEQHLDRLYNLAQSETARAEEREAEFAKTLEEAFTAAGINTRPVEGAN